MEVTVSLYHAIIESKYKSKFIEVIWGVLPLGLDHGEGTVHCNGVACLMGKLARELRKMPSKQQDITFSSPAFC